MDATILARIQFALTIGFHFLFPPLTIGLSWYIFWMMSQYKKTGSEFHRATVRFWTKIFTLGFAVGVATGITMEFQFGTNWSEYSRYVGDIFGAPLAAEGILAFFLESTFLGVLLFGWNRVSTKTMWFSSLMVALGSTLSAFWIIVANSWQQTPAGYHLNNGRAELTDFWAAVWNPSTIPRYLHTLDASMITGSIFVVGVSSWYLLKGRHLEFAKASLKKGLILGLIASMLQLVIGHFHGQQVARTQPEKVAAIEGIFETQKGAPVLIFGIPDPEAGEVKMAIEVPIPGLLSFLAMGDFDAEMLGLNDVPRDEWPPVVATFWSFHLMIGLGMYFIAFWVVGAFLYWRKKLFETRLYLKVAFFSIPLPFLANELGWIAAEVGRQPWAVYHLLKTRDAVSISVPAWQILASIIMFVVIYSLLFYLFIYLLKKIIKQGPQMEEGAIEAEVKA